jgi:predicted RecB family nuclease
MQRLADALVFSPSDLNHFLECEYLTRLDLDVANGRALEKRRPPEADLLAVKGEAHERFHLERFRGQGRDVVSLVDMDAGFDWSDAAQATRRAMAEGADVIYQGVLLADDWRGRADFLVRVELPSALGAWSYEVRDTKLARHAKPSHVLQLACYTEQVTAIQQCEPEWMEVILGTGEPARFRPRDFMAYFRVVRDRFVRAVHIGVEVSPYPVSHCSVCGYVDHCEERWADEDHLSLVAGIRRDQVERLHEIGVRASADLAALSGGVRVSIGEVALNRLRHQASLQMHFRQSGQHRYDLLPANEENGFRLLPPPSPGDVFFDIEGYPFFDALGGIEYLFGAVTADVGVVRYDAFRAADRNGEKRAFEQLIDFVWHRLQRWPDLHIYHYAHYEPTALKRLTALHATREEEVDELLRREAFTDLYQVVRRSIRISHDSYSLKAVRQFFMPGAGQGEVAGGAQSMIEFQRWLDTGDPRILDAIERYNEEDCLSTLELHKWLLECRREAEDRFGFAIPFRPLPVRREEPVETEPDEHADLRRRLGGVGESWATILGHLLDYHRREAKPEWWAYFDRRKKSLDDLLDDTEAISFLEASGKEPVQVFLSLVHTLRFPPQEFKLAADAKVEGPLGQGSVGSIEWIDAAGGTVGLRRGRNSAAPLPAALIAGGPVPTKAQRAALVRVGEGVARGEARYRALEDILRRGGPRFSPDRIGSIQTLEAVAQTQLVTDLDDSYLFVQGPPGSGKTWTGARMIVALIAAGKRVGVTATSHKAIHNLLREVERVARSQRLMFEGLKKRSEAEGTAFEGDFITSVRTNEECEGSNAPLIAGTAWLFAREGMDLALDYLFIDEAGQVSLADAVAVGTCARNIVLLGDPQQLPHVTKNTHPAGSGRSVLEHLLGDAATVAENRGLFLASSWRMHPDICRFVSQHSYEGRLVSAPGCELQTVVSSGLSGAGLRYVPVEHRHNVQQSPEEAEVVAGEVQRLLNGATVTDREGNTGPLVAAEILVVAPYNMQVRCLREALPEGVDVGTVDKFQGRQAAVVFFSMASSSGEDVPRGLEFLFNQNRFNVAVSRAKCLSVVVCSPRLLDTLCRTVEQMRLVNALCEFTERASPGPSRSAASLPDQHHESSESR